MNEITLLDEMNEIIILIGFTLGSLLDPMLIIICGIAGLALRNYFAAITVAILVVLPLNVALLSSIQSSPPPVFFLAKPIAVAIWVAPFWFGAQMWRKRNPKEE